MERAAGEVRRQVTRRTALTGLGLGLGPIGCSEGDGGGAGAGPAAAAWLRSHH